MSTIVLIAAIVLVVQGTFILLQPLPTYYRSFGLLTIFLAGLGFLGYHLSAAGILIYNPHLGVVMVQGPVARVGLSTLVFGFALVAGYGWRIARISSGWAGAIPWFLATGTSIGALAVYQITPLNPDALPPYRVYSYNVWWPVFSIWVALCVVESVASILNLRNKLTRWLFASAFIVALSLWGLHQSLDVNKPWWITSLLIALPATTGIAVYLASISVLKGRRLRIFVAIVSAAIGLATVSPLFYLGTGVSPVWSLGFLIFLSALLAAIAHTLFTAYKAGFLRLPNNPEELEDCTRRAVIVTTLLVIAFSIAAFFYNVTDLDRAIPLASFFIAWGVLADFVTSQGILHSIQHSLGSSESFKTFVKKNVDGLKAIVFFIPNGFRDFFKGTSTPGAVMHLVMGLVLLVALSEVPNAGKTIVMPFKTDAVESKKGLDQQIAERVIGNLGLINHQLRSDIIIPDTQRSGVSVAASDSLIPNDVVASNPIDVGGVSIPMSLFLWPVQIPVRSLLNVEVIGGSLHQSRTGYTLLANSTKGNSWVVRNSQDAAQQTNDSQRENEPAGPPTEAQAADQTETHDSPSVSTEAIGTLTEKLAFEILAANPDIQNLGMTKSWKAFQSYQLGLEDYREFERTEIHFTPSRFDKITSALAHLRESVKEDPNFALAHYRLGLALQRDGQPNTAIAAFRMSRKVNPNFVPAINALAYALYFSRGGTPEQDAAGNRGSETSNKKEARWLWQQVLNFKTTSPEELAMAIGGLGRIHFDNVYEQAPEVRSRDTLLASYYFSRAESIYERMSQKTRSSRAVKQAEGSLLNDLGVLHILAGHAPSARTPSAWHCFNPLGTTKGVVTNAEVSVSLSSEDEGFASAAFDYFVRALALQPDDAVIRCNAAEAAALLGNAVPMARLKADTHIREWRAGYFKQPDSVNYKQVMNEYETAIQLDPSNMRAMNGFAHAFWEWRRDVGQVPKGDLEIFERALQAESYIRKAVDLSITREDPGRTYYIGTLAEILLAQSRPQEAIEVIEEYYGKLVPVHPLFNEIRWDLAQAYLCAAERDRHWLQAHAQDEFRSPRQIKEFVRNAQNWIRRIRASERNRENRPYTADSSSLDTFSGLVQACIGDHEYSLYMMDDESEAIYLMNPKISYEKHEVCDWLGVQVTISELAPEDKKSNLVLHVWGGNSPRRISVKRQYSYAFLASSPKTTYDYYFVQLERVGNNGKPIRPVSPVYSIDTFDDCGKNKISLTFSPRNPSHQTQ